MILSSQLKEHVKGPKAAHVGTRDKDFTSDTVRVMGVIPTGHDSLKFFIAEKTAQRTVDNLRSNKLVALATTNVLNFESYQLKGRLLSIKPANDEEEAWIKEYIIQFDAEVTKIGLPQGFVINNILYLPALAVEFVVEQVFDQTPKIGTGNLVSTT